ncbi:MAG: hypothetical protein AMJ61_03430 [Desulfobacterales bacterium SG8_35_2]|nr:MAG: hypothetical protein AMJ61_03430 [Desulfobacterales bacterium SG8_35_2]
MKISKKKLALIDEWIELHQKIEKLEDELNSLTRKLKQINNKLFAKNSKAELEEFRDMLEAEIKKINKKKGKVKIGHLSSLKTIVEHDINIDNLVEQDIDINEKGLDIDLNEYKI